MQYLIMMLMIKQVFLPRVGSFWNASRCGVEEVSDVFPYARRGAED